MGCAGSSPTRYLAQQVEKAAFTLRTDAPVHRDTLVALLEAFPLHAVIEVTPGSELAHGGDHVIQRLVKIKVIVLVEQDGHGPVTGDLPGAPHHIRDVIRLVDSVPVQQQKVGTLNDVGQRHESAAVAGADEKAAATLNAILDAPNQFVNPFRFEDGLLVTHVAFVVDLDQHMAVIAGEQPVEGVIYSLHNGGFIAQHFFLPEVEDAQNHGHAQFVGAVEDALQPAHVVVAQAAISIDSRVHPGLFLRVSLRTAALQIDGKGQQAMHPPFRHGCDKLAGVAFGIPYVGIGVSPQVTGCRVQVVEDALHHAAVEQQALDALAPPCSPGVSRLAVDEKTLAFDLNSSVSGHRACSPGCSRSVSSLTCPRGCVKFCDPPRQTDTGPSAGKPAPHTVSLSSIYDI